MTKCFVKSVYLKIADDSTGGVYVTVPLSKNVALLVFLLLLLPFILPVFLPLLLGLLS